jgi:hypothetical protein
LVLEFFIFQFRKKIMSLKTKMINKTAAVFCVLMSAAVFAAPQTWTIPQTILTDSTTISGTFTYDAATQTASNPNIVATGTVPKTYTYLGSSDYLPNALVFQANQVGSADTVGESIYIDAPPSTGSQYTAYLSTFDCHTDLPSGSGLCHSSGRTISNAYNVVISAAIQNSAPTATSVSIAGNVQAGSTLTGSYTYTDADNDAQGTSTFRWVRNNTLTGVGGGTDVGTTTTYSPVAGDVGSYLYYCVTPVAAAGTTTGTEVCSAATSAVAVAPAPTAIPTLSEWAMIFLASLMGMFAFARIRRQS